jgi:hypothetical protein
MLYGNKVGKEEQKMQKLMECIMHTQAKQTNYHHCDYELWQFWKKQKNFKTSQIWIFSPRHALLNHALILAKAREYM